MSSLGSCTRAKRMYASICVGMRSANTGNACDVALIPIPSRICRFASYSRSVSTVLAVIVR